jgi:CRP-like cAMP-binding protein
MSSKVDIHQLMQLSPISSLKKDNLQALVKKTVVKIAQPGELIFKTGDTTKRTFYVLRGSVDLRVDDDTATSIIGGTDEAKNPLSARLPRWTSCSHGTKREPMRSASYRIKKRILTIG